MSECVRVFADRSPYWSAHDEPDNARSRARLLSQVTYEWLIMTLCIHVVCMRDGAIHYKVYLSKLTMAVDNIVFRIIKGAF